MEGKSKRELRWEMKKKQREAKGLDGIIETCELMESWLFFPQLENFEYLARSPIQNIKALDIFSSEPQQNIRNSQQLAYPKEDTSFPQNQDNKKPNVQNSRKTSDIPDRNEIQNVFSPSMQQVSGTPNSNENKAQYSREYIARQQEAKQYPGYSDVGYHPQHRGSYKEVGAFPKQFCLFFSLRINMELDRLLIDRIRNDLLMLRVLRARVLNSIEPKSRL